MMTPRHTQIEIHPYVYSEAKSIIDFCKSKGIKLQAYSPTAPVVSYSGESHCKVVQT